jgi:hypothetical protein
MYDIRIWEQVRGTVELRTDTLLREINQEISIDRSLHDYQGMYPVPWQMREVMLQRAETWIRRIYDLCCDAYKRSGKELSPEFDRAIWAYWIEPFIMREVQTTADGYRASKFLELLLCAVGSPPEKRRVLKVGEKDLCLGVRNEILFSWKQKLLHLATSVDQRTGLAPFEPRQPTAARTVVHPPREASTPQVSVSPVVSPTVAAAQPSVQQSATDSPDNESEIAFPKRPMPDPRYSGAAKWQDIEIVFLSDHRVQIRVNGKQTEPANYAELGFADGRSENPNKAWGTLRSLAEQRGVLKDGRTVGEPWPKVEKRIQEIRAVLRELFGISADPVPFVEGAGYQAVFKIRCGPSFHT